MSYDEVRGLEASGRPIDIRKKECVCAYAMETYGLRRGVNKVTLVGILK